MNQKDIYVYQILSKIISKLENLKSLILSLNTDFYWKNTFLLLF